MGISTGCAIVVGLQGEDLYEALPEEKQALIDKWGYYEVLGEDGAYDDAAPKPMGLDSYSPWFDCDPSYNYWGVGVHRTYSGGQEIGTETFDDFKSKVEAARTKFREITGLEGKIYMTPNVS